MEPLKLKHPFNIGDKVYTEIELKRPKAKDLENMGKQKSSNKVELQSRLLADCSNFSRVEISEMDGEDYQIATKMLADFLGSGQETGENE